MAEYEILKQKVYHDGTSMQVLKPRDRHNVPDRLVQSWRDEGIIAGDGKTAAAAGTGSDDDEVIADSNGVKLTSSGGGWFSIERTGEEPDRSCCAE